MCDKMTEPRHPSLPSPPPPPPSSSLALPKNMFGVFFSVFFLCPEVVYWGGVVYPSLCVFSIYFCILDTPPLVFFIFFLYTSLQVDRHGEKVVYWGGGCICLCGSSWGGAGAGGARARDVGSSPADVSKSRHPPLLWLLGVVTRLHAKNMQAQRMFTSRVLRWGFRTEGDCRS